MQTRSEMRHNPPSVRTRSALLILDLQNDFTSHNGKLPATFPADFKDHLVNLVSYVRDRGDDVVWISTEFQSPRHNIERENILIGQAPQVEATPEEQDSEDEMLRAALTRMKSGRTRAALQRFSAKTHEEKSPSGINPEDDHFLSGTNEFKQCCIPETSGAESPLQAEIYDEIKDIHMVKSYYSAFHESPLLTWLRSRLITELLLCGCLTNVSVFATAKEAAHLGFGICVVQDCLGYRSREIHHQALAQLADTVGALVKTSKDFCRTAKASTETSEAVKTNTPESPLRRSQHAMSLQRNAALKRPAEDDSVDQNRMSLEISSVPHRGSEVNSYESIESWVRNQSDGRKTSANGYQIQEKHAKPQILGPGDSIGDGDSYIVYDVDFQLVQRFGLREQVDIFQKIKDEVKWQKMYHVSGEVPRLVSVQGQFHSDGSMPVYRHPSDQSLPLLHFSAQVNEVRKVVEQLVGHAMNHVLIQLYRRGQDYISEHSDKTLDIERGSNIVNVSFGAQRTMRLRTKRPRQAEGCSDNNARTTQIVPMPHGSVFVLGSRTNTRWLHGINADKRAARDRDESELAYNGERISLTFRNIGTFLDSSNSKIWGQGAKSKNSESAGWVVNGNPEETQRLIRAFGIENQSTQFDWDLVYGGGFDVLHFSSLPSPTTCLLYPSRDSASTLTCQIYLEELGIPYQLFGVQPEEAGHLYDPELSFHDMDTHKTQVDGVVSILFYLGRFYSKNESKSLLVHSMPLLLEYTQWRQTLSDQTQMQKFLSYLNDILNTWPYLSGTDFNAVDCAYWPLVDESLEARGDVGNDYMTLRDWHARLGNRESVRTAMWSDARG